MKKLFLIVPAILAAFLLNSFTEKESGKGGKTMCNAKANSNVPKGANIIIKSDDGGQTWQDISEGLPSAELPTAFFAGESDLYLHQNNAMYHSKSNLEIPVWEKEDIPGLNSGAYTPSTSIAFNGAGVMAYNYNGQIYQKKPSAETWLPMHANFKKYSMRYVFETSSGILFMGFDDGLYKSADSGKNWKQVQKDAVFSMVESGGVLVAGGAGGIMRSTDNGEHWQWVISEGGVGIAVEPIKGGFAAISYNTTTQSRRIHISLDGGATWKPVSDGLPPSWSISSVRQVGNYLLCGHPDGIFLSADMGNTWRVVHPGDGKNVFRLHTSGNTLYAVAGNAGC